MSRFFENGFGVLLWVGRNNIRFYIQPDRTHHADLYKANFALVQFIILLNSVYVCELTNTIMHNLYLKIYIYGVRMPKNLLYKYIFTNKFK